MGTTAEPTTGTAVLDGLIEGPVPPLEDGETHLRQWVAFAASAGIPFHLTIEGPAFNLLAGSDPVELQEAQELQERICQLIEQLLDLFPEDLRGRIFSTVRSTEYRQEEKLQSLYSLTSRGVQVREKAVAAGEKEEGEPSESLPRHYLPFLIGAGVVVLLLILSLFVIDYSSVLRKYRDKYLPVKAERIEVASDPGLDRYVSFTRKGLDDGRRRIEIELRRAPGFPTDLRSYRAAEDRVREQGKLEDLLALHKVVLEGTLRAEYLDREGEVLEDRDVSVRELVQAESIILRLPIRSHPDTARIRFRY